jgi:murein DD-endopeptidase MepM/ murein hydrolase activator NlpD
LRRLLVLATLAVSFTVASAATAADPVAHSGRLAGSLSVGIGPDGPTAAERALIDLRIAQYEEAHPEAPTTKHLYPFYPQGGTLWQDLFVNNFTDQDSAAGTFRDFDCTEFAYDGHQGHDSIVRSFVEKRIGVPIFAALPGTVVDRHDGEPDENTTLNNVPANYVIVDNGGGHRSLYWHMRNGSVAVALNQTVVAGQQLGLTASSGYSNWPHLHFESQDNGVWYEPSRGACGPSQSWWVSQTPIPRGIYLRDFTFSPNAFTNTYPDDTATRTGYYNQNATQIYFRFEVGDGSAVASPAYAVRVRRPDSSLANSFSGTLSGAGRSSIFWFQANQTLNVTGQWHLELDYRGVSNVVNAPFDVLSPGSGRSLGPRGVGLAFDPAAPVNGDVLFCRVQTSLAFEHQDYHIVKYQYVWRVNNVIVRNNTFGGLADALPADQVLTGRLIRCDVTPIDNSNGIGATQTASVSATVAGPTAATLRAFTAKRTSQGTLVRWRTGAESNLLGFNVYRAGDQLNRTLISSVFGGAAYGHAYSWLDRVAPQRRVLRYRLQGVALNGTRRWLGSIAVGA